MSKRQALQRGHLVIRSHGELAATVEIECRYPDILVAVLHSFMRSGARAEWRARVEAQPETSSCQHEWENGSCRLCNQRYHGMTPPKPHYCAHGQLIGTICEDCQRESTNA